MDPDELESLVLRAVELEVQGRADPRLLVVTRPRIGGRRKAARLVAGLANSSAGRSAIALFGIAGADVVGVDDPPPSDFWRRVVRALPGAVPALSSTTVRIAEADVVAVHVAAPGDLVAAWRRNQVEVPFVHDGKLSLTPPRAPATAPTSSERLPTFDIEAGWVERNPVGSGSVVTYRGAVDLELHAAAGKLTDADCSATLLVADTTLPINLDVQVHPITTDVGVRRIDGGIEVATSFQARMYLAAARARHDGSPLPMEAAQLVLSLLLPGRTVPEVRTLFLVGDRSREDRWTVR